MSVRIGRRGLARIADQLSSRDLEILHSTATHRLLSGKQLERFHFTDHATVETGARVCRQVLARLTRDGLLRRLERRVGGVRAGSASFVYCLGPAGRRLTGELTARRVGEPSAGFLEHTLQVAETHLRLREAAAGGAFDLEQVEIEPSCWRSFLGPSGAREWVKPDLFVVSGSGELEYCWFLEVDLGSEHKPTIIRKCEAYQRYYRIGVEQQRIGTFPLVVWVARDGKRRDELQRAIAAARGLKPELFQVVIASELVELFSGSTAR